MALFARLSGRLLTLVVLAAALLALPASVSADDKDATGDGPAAVTTASDAAMDKLHPKLEEQVESGSTETISVFVTVEGNAAAATSALDDAKVAESGGVALVVGEISVQALPKLAGKKGVVSVGPIELEQTGQPLGSPDPELRRPFDKEKVNEALKGLYKREVPYSKAPALKGSNFEDLKKLAVLDAKTHDFADAWRAGFTGAGRHRRRARRRHRLRASRPDRHVAGLVERARSGLERLAEGLRPVRHAAVARAPSNIDRRPVAGTR